jgi:hypothetical protein
MGVFRGISLSPGDEENLMPEKKLSRRTVLLVASRLRLRCARRQRIFYPGRSA